MQEGGDCCCCFVIAKIAVGPPLCVLGVKIVLLVADVVPVLLVVTRLATGG